MNGGSNSISFEKFRWVLFKMEIICSTLKFEKYYLLICICKLLLTYYASMHEIKIHRCGMHARVYGSQCKNEPGRLCVLLI